MRDVGDELRLEPRGLGLAPDQPIGRDEPGGDHEQEEAEGAGEQHDLAVDRRPRRDSRRLVEREAPRRQDLTERHRGDDLGTLAARAPVHQPVPMIGDGQERRLGSAEGGLEHVAPEDLEVRAPGARGRPGAPRPRPDTPRPARLRRPGAPCRPASKRPRARSASGPARASPGGAPAPGYTVRPVPSNRAIRAMSGVSASRRSRAAGATAPLRGRRLEASHDAVLGVPERQIHLLRDHDRHAPRLLAEQLVRRPAPLAERVVSEDRQDRRGDDDREEGEGREADQGGAAGARHPRSSRRRRSIASISG